MARPIDDRALYDRDQDREPRAAWRHARHRANLLGPRHAFQVRIDPSITAVACPACNGPTFVPADSDNESITCADPTCGRALITRQGPDGVEVLLHDGGGR